MCRQGFVEWQFSSLHSTGERNQDNRQYRSRQGDDRHVFFVGEVSCVGGNQTLLHFLCLLLFKTELRVLFLCTRRTHMKEVTKVDKLKGAP